MEDETVPEFQRKSQKAGSTGCFAGIHQRIAAGEALSESNKLTGIGTEMLKQKIDELMDDIAKKKSKVSQIE